VLVVAIQVHAHDFGESWNAQLYPVACVIESEPGVNFLSESTDSSRPEISVIITLGALHPEEINFFHDVPGLNPHPYIVSFQVLTGLTVRSEEITVSGVLILIDEESITPIRKPGSEQDDFPIDYLGGAEAVRFLKQLESGISPIVLVMLNGGDKIQIPVFLRGFQVSNAMMKACIDEIRTTAAE
jgi:hypothetical protein